MTQVQTTPPDPSAAENAAASQLSAALEVAFPPIESTLDSQLDAIDVQPVQPDDAEPTDPSLRAVVPAPDPVQLDEIAEEFSRQRILFRRGPASVSVEALISVGGALILHALFLSLFYIGFNYAIDAANRGRAGVAVEADSGGNGGYMVMGSGPTGDPSLGGDVINLLAKAAKSAEPSLPNLQQLPAPVETPSEEIVIQSPAPSIIGTPRSVTDLGAIRIRAPKVQTDATAQLDVTRIIAPVTPPRSTTAQTDPDSTAVASASGKTGPTAGSPTPGSGLGGTDEEEPVVEIMKPGSGGTGNGSGRHVGNGTDRGASGANNESPQVLDAPPLEVPSALRLKPPPRSAIFEVTVLPSGKPGKIELTQACGQPEIDALCQATVARYRFRPAYLAGQAVTKSMTVSFSFGTGP